MVFFVVSNELNEKAWLKTKNVSRHVQIASTLAVLFSTDKQTEGIISYFYKTPPIPVFDSTTKPDKGLKRGCSKSKLFGQRDDVIVPHKSTKLLLRVFLFN